MSLALMDPTSRAAATAAAGGMDLEAEAAKVAVAVVMEGGMGLTVAMAEAAEGEEGVTAAVEVARLAITVVRLVTWLEIAFKVAAEVLAGDTAAAAEVLGGDTAAAVAAEAEAEDPATLAAKWVTSLGNALTRSEVYRL